MNKNIKEILGLPKPGGAVRSEVTDGNIIEAILAADYEDKEVVFVMPYELEPYPKTSALEERIEAFLPLTLSAVPGRVHHRPFFVAYGFGTIRVLMMRQDGIGLRGIHPDHLVYDEAMFEIEVTINGTPSVTDMIINGALSSDHLYKTEKANLGLATNAELLEELSCRWELGHKDPDYSTVRYVS